MNGPDANRPLARNAGGIMARHRVSLIRARTLVSAVVVLVIGIAFTTPVGRGTNAAADEAAGVWDREEASEAAKELGEPVQVLEDTAQDVIVQANPDGTYSAELSSGPVRVADPQSPTGWSDIDLTLVQEGGAIRPTVADAEISFSDGGPGALASIGKDGVEYALSPSGDLPEPSLSGNTATYPDYLPGIDLVFRARAAGWDQSFVVHSPPGAPLVLDLPLSLDGVDAEVDEKDQLILTDEEGNRVAQSTPAVMFGAETDPHTDEPVHSAVVDTAIVSGQNGPVLRVSPDPGFFSTPGLRFPVTVDPSPDFSVDTDTYVRSGDPTSSYSTDQQLKSGLNSSDIHRTLVRFDGLGVLNHTWILEATLELFEIHSYSCTASEVRVYEMTSAFSSTTNWNNQPSAGDLYASETTAHGYSGSCSNDWVVFSDGGQDGLMIKDLVQEWAWNTLANRGFLIKAGSETDPEGWKKFAASEYGSNPPVLSVTYSIPALDGSDSIDGVTGWSQDVISSPEDYVSDQAGQRCLNPNPGAGSSETWEYSDFIAKFPSPTNHGLLVDEYQPPNPGPTEEFPAMVLVHGGGWSAGCRGVVSSVARIFAGLDQTHPVDQEFIVFSIDYRLACLIGTYSDAMASPMPYLCGWGWDTEDEQEQTRAAVRDVEAAIAWVRDGQDGWDGDFREHWNGQVVALGTSAGGNLVASAGAESTEEADFRPDAAAILSGFPENDQTNDAQGHWSCDSGSTNATNCWLHINNYLHCWDPEDGLQGEVYEPCKGQQGDGTYDLSSPKNGYENPNDNPPMFIANAGGPFGEDENTDLSPLQEAVDFDNWLVEEAGYQAGDHFLCVVDETRHATGFLVGYSCDAGVPQGEEVYESIVAFFVDILGL